MNDYEDFKPLFSFLKSKKNPKKHWNDTILWEIGNHVHNHVLATNKFVIEVARFVALICDELTTLDNQSWIFVHGCCVEDSCEIPMGESMVKYAKKKSHM
jgi:hypothetical protein